MISDLRINIVTLKNLLLKIKNEFEPSFELKNSFQTYETVMQALSVCYDIDDLLTDRITDREREVIKLVIEGYSNSEIGEKLFICEKTVKFHLSSIFKKLGVKTKTNLIVEYYKNELSKVKSDQNILQREVERLSSGNSRGCDELPAGSSS